ncbi:MAG: hypothetical protein IJZ30_00260 [Alphaproteobacteria bacterium]|nr:hypothetical protein [Alphaproteobacteria bacterium]
MKIKILIVLLAVILGVGVPKGDVFAAVKNLRPQDFNKMYYLAKNGKVGILRNAVNRGLNIDSVNLNGDTGLCIAIKRKDYVAYNSFRMSGANPRHQCTYRIHKEYQEFLASTKTVREEKILGNKESLYYDGSDFELNPWILGGIAIGGGLLAFSGGGGGGSSAPLGNMNGSNITTIEPGIGLSGYVENYEELISGEKKENETNYSFENNELGNINSIKLLPNTIKQADLIKTYYKVENGGILDNRGTLSLGDGVIGIAVHGDKSQAFSKGNIDIKAGNGSIGMSASNGALAVNGKDSKEYNDGNIDMAGSNIKEDNLGYGNINMSFKGGTEGNSLIGMYADTNSVITNYGKITGTTSVAFEGTDEGASGDLVLGDGIIEDDASQEEGSEEDEDRVIIPNSGSMLGMGVFDFYTGTNLSSNTVRATNMGTIQLSAGYNAATGIGVSLVGMGSYIDEMFLNENYNPYFAEQMELENSKDADIKLSYKGEYTISDTALKLGKGGLIGIRADASTKATNLGNIDINLTSTTLSGGVDVAAGMLSVHGAELINGNEDYVYDGTGSAVGVIRIKNEANSGGVTYGMLASKGDGSQTRIYEWKDPKLLNYGLIDMQVSNSYAMASFDGGEITNYGVINLGVENGQSYYTNNYGMFAAGADKTDLVNMVNEGIINVYSMQSTAILNEFSGSVNITNNGRIYLSNKATGSKVFGDNFSKITNSGAIDYKVGNSENYPIAGGGADDVGITVKNTPIASVVSVSGDSASTKQTFLNEENGVITLGDIWRDNVDYGGTYGTAVVSVSKQGSAFNHGDIVLNLYEEDINQYNTGIYVDTTATAEAYAENYGNIFVASHDSIGIRNDSTQGASARNFGNIYVTGKYSHGMAATSLNANLFNGLSGTSSIYTPNIYVMGLGSEGIYLKNGQAYNYGTIYLMNNSTTAFLLDGPDSKVLVNGEIVYNAGLDNIVFYMMTNEAKKMFEDYNFEIIVKDDGSVDGSGKGFINGFTLGKAITSESGGYAYFSKSSTAYVTGSNSHLLVAVGKGSEVYNKGKVDVVNSATALVAQNEGKAYHDGRDAYMAVKDKDSIGIKAEGSGSYAGVTPGAEIDVFEGKGGYAENFATVENYGVINVKKDSVGIGAIDGVPSIQSKAINSGVIIVEGTKSIGVNAKSGAYAYNYGDLSVSAQDATAGDISTYAYGIYSTEKVENSTNGDLKGTISVGDHAIGIYSNNAINSAGGESEPGGIFVNSSTSIGVYGAVENTGMISVSSGVGVKGSAENSGSIVVELGGIGVEGIVKNEGNINVYDYNSIGVKGSGSNEGAINTNGIGVYATGIFSNNANITGNGTVVYVDGGGFENNGDVVIGSASKGIHVKSGSVTNNGTITIGSGIGVYLEDGTRGENNGSITVTGAGTAVYVESGASFTNNNIISFDSAKSGKCNDGDGSFGGTGECVDASAKEEETEEGAEVASVATLLELNNGASFVNKGIVNFDDREIDFSDRAEDTSYVIGKGGSYKANSFKGEVLASKDIVMGGFENSYKNKDSFVGENNGLSIKSQSYMFDAKINNNKDVSDVELNRKSFEELVEEKDLGEFFEMNYNLAHNEKMYNSLKSATNKKEFNAVVESESGKKFYANLPRENMAVVRNITSTEQRKILNDGLDGVSVGANVYRTGKDGIDNLSGYEADIYTASLLNGWKLNKNWNMGLGLSASYVDSQYDDVNSDKENKIIMAFMPILYKNNNFKYLGTITAGAGMGSYNRNAMSGNYEADTFDIYYGMNNSIEYSVDMKVAELVAEAELNLQGIASDDADENNEGFVLKSNNSLSLEAGIGLKLRKTIEFAKNRSLMFAIGSKYYHEFLDPYKRLDVTMKGSPVSFDAGYYDEDKNRLKTTAEAMYKDGDLSVGAEISHISEKESNIEGGVGVRYSF